MYFIRDTLFFEDFSLSGFISDFLSCSAKTEEGALVSCYKCRDEGTILLLFIRTYTITCVTLCLETSKVGIVEIDSTGKITSFLEKPLPSATPSRLAVSLTYSSLCTHVYAYLIVKVFLPLVQCPCFYMLSRGSLKLLPLFLDDKKVSQ